MTRMARISNGGGVRRVVSLHRQSGQCRIVMLEARGGGAAVLEARSVREGEIASSLAQIAKEHKPERLIRVAPGSLSVCRGVEVPDGDAASMGAALALLAEAQLPEGLPAHRRAAGVIAGRASEGNRLALLTACRDGVPPLSASPAPEFWVAEIAALAVLRGGHGTALYADRSDGSIAIIAEGSRRTVARILVESGETSSAWTAAVRSALSETCAAAGAEPATAPPVTDLTLELPRESADAIKERVGGVRDERWLSEYGMALGGALVAVDHDPLTAMLASMTPDGRIVREPVIERAAAWLGRPRNAWATAAAAAALLLLGPLAIAGARLAILESKSGALQAGWQERLEVDRKAALYAQLEQVRWPMTKLMADVAGATPVGVVVSDFRIGNEMGLSVNGSAETLDQLYTFQRNLANSRIFREVKINRQEFAGERVAFDLVAEVASPQTRAKPAEDFAAQSLAVRMYGEGASNTATPVTFKKPEANPSRPAASRSGPAESGPSRTEDSEERRAGGDAEASRRPATGATADAPPPITDEQIAALDFGKANLEWAKRKGAASRATDEAVKTRLQEEVKKLEAHREKLKGGGS